MHFKNVDSWKDGMKKIAKAKQLDVQDVQQRFVLEEFALKIAQSRYKEQLVLKGGFVVSTLLGLDTRMTKDLDVTYKSTVYKLDELERVILEIIGTPSESFEG